MAICGSSFLAAPRQRSLASAAAEVLALSASRRSKWCRTATDSTIDRFSAATSSTAREMISAPLSVSVHPTVHPSATTSENTVFPASRTTGTLLPKLDVEGSSPFARSLVFAGITCESRDILAFFARADFSPDGLRCPAEPSKAPRFPEVGTTIGTTGLVTCPP